MREMLFWILWVETCPKFEDENLSETFKAKMEFCKIGPLWVAADLAIASQVAGREF
jgi:hypothetical protein